MNSCCKLTPIFIGVCSALYGHTTLAQEDQISIQKERPYLEVVVVKGSQITVDREELEQPPIDNPSISQALKHEPRIGIDDAQSSMQGGDLRPEEISISGARPHQTKYTIGGMGVNNSTTFGNDNERPTDLTSGHTSGYFVDTNLVDSIEVLDHNIGAEHGGFTGGVINAELRKPTDDFVVDYNFRMNDSDWNSPQKVGENFKDSYGAAIDGSGKYQPNFQKRMHALHLGGAISDTQNLAINVSHQESDIPLEQNKDVNQTMDNIFVTHIWEKGTLQTTTNLRYANHQSNNFLKDHPFSDYETTENSEVTNAHQGLGGTINITHTLPFGKWGHTLSYDQLTDKRNANNDYFVNYMKRENNGFTFRNEGSYGNLKQKQDSYQFKSRLYGNPTVFWRIENIPSIGVEVSHQVGTVNRPKNHVVYQHQEMVPGRPTISNLTRYYKANYNTDAQQYSLFASNQMQLDRWGLYLGGRLDHMSVFDATVFSPRLNISWDFDLVDTNRLTFGANRYYSANLLGWALKAEQKKYQSNSRSCTPNDGNWQNLSPDNLTCRTTTEYEGLELNQADVPYSDEYTASWAVDVNNFALNTVYIYRQQRDGLSYSTDSAEGTATIHNNVKSDDQIVSFEATTIQPYELAGGHFSANWKVSYNHRRGHGDLKATYDQGNDLNGGFQDDWVLIDGQLVRYGEMDVSGYQSPIKSSLDLNMYWQDIGLVWNNRVNYQQGKKTTAFQGMASVEIDGQMESVNSLATTELDDLFTWDMAVNWTPAQLDDHVILGLSITNLLNTQEVVSVSGTQLGNNIPNEHYNSGRQVWLNINVRN
ncbi:hypothetical protein BIY22_07630 [Vibrio panuliri]|uniref:TonB-dependent receptor plug domain-containing protein n=1 Tax=Vibrio panuliri TaxID=1381081 RepID=A0A1Q9HE66_9VIBR|nr:TonB-dependent receptor plug domain-containing protein [Vibrio panuliri]OLQ88035.1 hypothetical protein BIY22_07630 [Vibrio panuliri]